MLSREVKPASDTGRRHHWYRGSKRDGEKKFRVGCFRYTRAMRLGEWILDPLPDILWCNFPIYFFFPQLLSFFSSSYFVSETKVVDNVNADEVSSSLGYRIHYSLTIDILLTVFRGSFSSCYADCFFRRYQFSEKNFVISKFRSIHGFKP